MTRAEYEEGAASQKQAQNTKPNAARDEECSAKAASQCEYSARAAGQREGYPLVARLTACNADTPKLTFYPLQNPDSRPARQCMRIEKPAKFDAWLIKLDMQHLCLPVVSYRRYRHGSSVTTRYDLALWLNVGVDSPFRLRVTSTQAPTQELWFTSSLCLLQREFTRSTLSSRHVDGNEHSIWGPSVWQ